MSTQVATLPWYDLPETRVHQQRLWQGIAARLRRQGIGDLPRRLQYSRQATRDWHDPNLLLGQACGLDAVLEEAPPIRVIATPEYAFRGCDGPTYRSFVVVREDDRAQAVRDLRGARCVINSPSSHSGMNGLRELVAPMHQQGRFFASVEVTGAHQQSLAWVRAGRADVAAIDCITWGLLERHRPRDLETLRIVAETLPTRAPPYVTRDSAGGAMISALRGALANAVAGLSADDRLALGLRAVRPSARSDYAPIAAAARRAEALGYREFRSPAVAS